MKRLLPVLLVLLLIPCFIIPASATSTNTILENIHESVDDIWIQNDIWYEIFGDYLSTIADTLDWIDGSLDWLRYNCLNLIQTAVDSISKTLNTLVTPITTGMEKLGDIYDMLVINFNIKSSDDFEVIEDGEDKADEIDDITDIIATSPSFDDDAIDDVIIDVQDDFSGMTTDESGNMYFSALGNIANSAVGFSIVPMSAMLGVVSFLLFGKVF